MPNILDYYHPTQKLYVGLTYDMTIQVLHDWDMGYYGVSRDDPKEVMQMVARNGVAVSRNVYANLWVRTIGIKRTEFNVRVDQRIPELPF